MSTVVDDRDKRDPRRPASRLMAARTRQTECRARYRDVIGSAYEPEAYSELLEATRDLLACERQLRATAQRGRQAA